jgi:hypothetical protein
MEAIRSIQTVANGEVSLRLPKQFWGQEVEVIVLPAPVETAQTLTRKKSLRGSLRHYANPALIEQEQDAWGSATGDKYASG